MTRSPRVAWIPTANDPRIGSARLRCFHPLRSLRNAGWSAEVYRPGGAYDAVVFQKAYSEDLLGLASDLKEGGVRVVFDLCDNHFYNPNNHPVLAERAARLSRMIDLADLVTASTPEIAQLVPDKEVHVVDDALDRFDSPVSRVTAAARRGSSRRTTRFVWFGNAGGDNPPFGLGHVRKLLPLLESLSDEIPLSLTIISNSPEEFARTLPAPRFALRYRNWMLRSFAHTFVRHDVCVLPVELNPFTRCKTANRVAQSLLLGVPVIADPVPSFLEFSRFILLNDWESHLKQYALDKTLRRAHADAGRRYVRATHTPQRVAYQWQRVFAHVLAESDPSDSFPLGQSSEASQVLKQAHPAPIVEQQTPHQGEGE